MDDRASHYRARSVELRKIADSTTDETMRKSLLDNVAHYEHIARALDSMAPAKAKPVS
jgi:hypothetical protein